LPHKLCPICKKHSIIERLVWHNPNDCGEDVTEWYCRTCKEVISPRVLFPHCYRKSTDEQLNELNEWCEGCRQDNLQFETAPGFNPSCSSCPVNRAQRQLRKAGVKSS